jgi:hypothetical protein
VLGLPSAPFDMGQLVPRASPHRKSGHEFHKAGTPLEKMRALRE